MWRMPVGSLCLALFGFLSLEAGVAPGPPIDLRCEYLVRPSVVDAARPCFSWTLQHSERAERQTACQVQVYEEADAQRRLVWDSGKLSSSDSVNIEYAGRPLRSNATYCWKVRVWDSRDSVSPYSTDAIFETGLLNRSEWSGQWIGGYPRLRRVFRIPGKVRRARAFVTGLGLFEFHLNGARVGCDLLEPAWTSYDKRVFYRAYDVTDLLREGPNAAAAMLGAGRYGSYAFLLELRLEMEDGTRMTVASDAGWSGGGSPIVSSSLYDGEVYDARLEQPGWDEPGFTGTGWSPVTMVAGPAGQLSGALLPPIRVIDTLAAQAVSSPRPGTYIFDFGQNLSGWVRLEVRGEEGQRVRLRFGELLYPDGSLNRATLRGARAEDIYILKGQGRESFVPHFTYHGFRYVEVDGFPGVPGLSDLRAEVVHTDVIPTGSFLCSRPLLNRLQQMVYWTQKTNLHGIPTDNNQRDERLGWLGDAHLTAETAMLNFDVAAFYRAYLRSIVDTQDKDGCLADTVPHVAGRRPSDPAWGSALPIIAWHLYQYFGDLQTLRESYPAVRAFVGSLRREAGGAVLRRSHYGDWVALEETPGEIVSTFFYYQDAVILSRMAGVLGKEADQQEYARLAGEIRAAFHHCFYDGPAATYGPGTQTAIALALLMDAVPETERRRVVLTLFSDIVYRHNTHLSTGIIGTKYLMEALPQVNRPELAYDLATQTTYPSWGYMIDRGATTFWELWQQRAGRRMNSHNQPMFDTVGAWLYRWIAGIQAGEDSPGFERFTIRPSVVGDLTHAAATLRTVRGTVTSDWRWRAADNRLEMILEVPVGATATVFVPGLNLAAPRISEGGQMIWSDEKQVGSVPGLLAMARTEDAFRLKMGSGRYRLVLEE